MRADAGLRNAQLYEVVGLYANPRAHAFLLSIDEQSQIQALDRA